MTRPLTAFVLTGGKSSRMGSDKAMLRLADGETLVEHALALAASVAAEVRLIGSREKYAALAWAGEIVEDIYPDSGPLAGIHAGLQSTGTDLNLVLAVDMPSMTSNCLEYLVHRAENSDALVVVPEVDGLQQPLCAIYRKAFFAVAEQSLAAGRKKVNAAFVPESTLVVRQDELEAVGFAPSLFRNVNTGAEWANFNSHPQS